MSCVACGRTFIEGERRFKFSAGWFCWPCFLIQCESPQGECWGGCGQVITVQEHTVLVDIIIYGEQIKGRYMHDACYQKRQGRR